ncbi:membrane-associated proteins in eicosanoid and glutathione metabolism [Trametopsis cervina]|nr:membrane-associated proteins in eicosanoid and glutathione metabolism [Trametopsis cervina]
MSMPDFLPKGYSYVVAAVVSTFWVTVYQTYNVEVTRKRAKIPYPQLYAEKAEAALSKEAQIFNCAQRAHQNTLEFLPQIYVSTLVIGLKYPLTAAALCGFWSVGRIFYTLGYTTGDAAKRISIVSTLANMGALFGLVMGGATFTAYQWLKSDAFA